LVSKCEIFTPFCYKYIQVTACKKIGFLDLSMINEQGCNFLAHSVVVLCALCSILRVHIVFCIFVFCVTQNSMTYSLCWLQKMAAEKKLSIGEDEDEDDQRRVLEEEISELRSAKKELFERTRPINEELERVAQRERECVDKLHRLTTEKHDRQQQHEAVKRLIELESEMKRVKSENETLKHEITACSNLNSKLKRSLEQKTKQSRLHVKRTMALNEQLCAEQQLRKAYEKAAASGTKDSSGDGELQKQLTSTTDLLNKTKEELRETRQRLSDVQERLTVAEQVTAATQQRALQESINDSEQLQVLELTPQHQPTTKTGADMLTYLSSSYYAHQHLMNIITSDEHRTLS